MLPDRGWVAGPGHGPDCKRRLSMRARYKVVLQGFSEFERNALTFCLKLTGEREPAYEPVPRLAQTDFVIADADQTGVIDAIVEAGRTGVTVFVGRHAPADARSHISRPI